MDLLVTNTEQVQPDDRSDTQIKLYGRDGDGNQRTVTVYGFEPYLYAPRDEVEGRVKHLLQEDCITEIDLEPEPVDESLSGKRLAKIVTPYPQDVRDAREFFDDPHAADVPFTDRFRIDTGVRAVVRVPDSLKESGTWECKYTEIEPLEGGSGDDTPAPQGGETGFQDVEPRIVTLDIEVDDRGGFPEKGEERILTIVAHDSYTDEYVGWIDLDGRPLGEAMPEVAEEQEAPGVLDKLHFEDDERKMLINFAVWLGKTADPDIVTGWNVDGFDLPYLLHRMSEVGVQRNRLSREGWAGFNWRDEPRIKGRTVYDLLTVYKKNQRHELQSYSLDYVAKEELGEEKMKHDEGFFELYEKDPARLLEYNARDVRLTADINETADVIHFRDLLRRQVGVDFEDSYDNKDFVDMMSRRRLREWGLAGPVRPSWGEVESTDFEGAHVFEPYNGLTENVVGMDLKSLYPMTMAMLNASPETKVDGTLLDKKDSKGRWLADVGHTPEGDVIEVPVHVADGGTLFRADKQGLFPSLVDDAIELKARYKKLKNAADNKEDRKFYETQYGVSKTITNSLYGVIGWERFFLYDVDVAEAVTLSGQAVIKATANYVERAGVEVIYGDTDSVYVQFPDDFSREECLDDAISFARELNETVYQEMAEERGTEENLWEIEVEAYMERYFQAGKKKRYAYLATWKDGNIIEDAEPTIVGFEYIRSDSSRITSDAQKDVLYAILEGREDEVGDIVYSYADEIKTEEPDWERIGIPGGLQQKIDADRAGQDDYYAFSDDGYPQDAHPRGVWNANKILDLDLGHGDKPMRVYLKPRYFAEVDRNINVIAFEEADDLEPIEKKLRVDVPRMVSTILVNPLEKVTSAIGVDASAAAHGQHQTGLGAFT